MNTGSPADVRLAFIGCGAMVERLHLPRLAGRTDCRLDALVDLDHPRASALARSFDVPRALTDYRQLISSGDIDAALVALPNHLHAPVSIELLRAGIHVLVEKPMALTAADCDAMMAAAREGGAVLAVGLMRRFSHAGRFVKWAVESGLLGRVQSFEFRDGFIYNWPVTSDSFLRKESSGGGVLMDLGAHTLDQLLWWLGDAESFEYYDDDYGGVEADCELRLRLASGAEGTVHCSRTRDLGQYAVIRGEKAEIEVSLIRNSIAIRFDSGDLSLSGHAGLRGQPALPQQRIRDLITDEHTDFIRAIRLGRPPAVTGDEGRRSVELVEACYAVRRPLRLPWVESKPAVVPPEVGVRC